MGELYIENGKKVLSEPQIKDFLVRYRLSHYNITLADVQADLHTIEQKHKQYIALHDVLQSQSNSGYIFFAECTLKEKIIMGLPPNAAKLQGKRKKHSSLGKKQKLVNPGKCSASVWSTTFLYRSAGEMKCTRCKAEWNITATMSISMSGCQEGGCEMDVRPAMWIDISRLDNILSSK